MFKIFGYSTLILFFTNCQVNTHQQNEQINTSFSLEDLEEPILLRSESILTAESLFPRAVNLTRNFIVLAEHEADTLLSIYDRFSYVFVGKVGINGVGPGEIDVPWDVNSNLYSDFIWVNQPQIKRYSGFDLAVPSVYSTSEIALQEGLKFARDLVFASDTSFFAVTGTSSEKYEYYNLKGRKMGGIGSWYTRLPKDLPPHAAATLFQGQLRASPDLSHFVFASLKTDIIDIIDANEKSIRTTSGPLNYMEGYTLEQVGKYKRLVFQPEETYYMYTDIKLTESKIYALFSGRTFNEVNYTKDQYNDLVIVFDYKGNMLHSYKLDQSIYGSLAVDEENGIFYGISFDDNPRLLSFRF